MIAELCNSILNIDFTQRSLSVLIYAILKHLNVPDSDADSFLLDITLNSVKHLLVKGKYLGKYIHLSTKLGSLFCEKKGIKVKKKQNNKI
ncbi:hypothetical protein BpHYR1_041908 [Brachionus plicatilis]|uniref:Uncharacterized protein n=1 Tax=Brachionus plicatilis TaxID=10195 RepID=A0A3M7S193_BRAPC|nr:hypothetical protein BpHYR1_041908 [Brachionus plicatilis]